MEDIQAGDLILVSLNNTKDSGYIPGYYIVQCVYDGRRQDGERSYIYVVDRPTYTPLKKKPIREVHSLDHINGFIRIVKV
jgi:hypothetical protein